MRVELHDDLKGAISIPASRIVVYDHFDNPIALVVRLENGQYIAATVTNDIFPKLLKALGIQKTVIVDRLDAKKLLPLT